jgi:hypothetical protein
MAGANEASARFIVYFAHGRALASFTGLREGAGRPAAHGRGLGSRIWHCIKLRNSEATGADNIVHSNIRCRLEPVLLSNCNGPKQFAPKTFA